MPQAADSAVCRAIMVLMACLLLLLVGYIQWRRVAERRARMQEATRRKVEAAIASECPSEARSAPAAVKMKKRQMRAMEAQEFDDDDDDYVGGASPKDLHIPRRAAAFEMANMAGSADMEL